jgi:hypothetical protein
MDIFTILWAFVTDVKNTPYLLFMLPFVIIYIVKGFRYLKNKISSSGYRISQVKVAGQEISFSEKSGQKELDHRRTCMDCESRIIQALPILLTELRIKDHSILKAEYNIENYGTLKRQMAVAENAMGKVRTLLTKRFFSLMETSRGEGGRLEGVVDLNHHEDYVFYTIAIKVIFESGLNQVRSWFRENGMEDIPEQDFLRLYVDPRIETLIQMASEEMNALWHGKFVERAELYEANRELFPDVKSILTDTFIQARQLAKDAVEETDRLEAEYMESADKLLKDFIKRYTFLPDEDQKALANTAKPMNWKEK